jgi:hypothetical protein
MQLHISERKRMFQVRRNTSCGNEYLFSLRLYVIAGFLNALQVVDRIRSFDILTLFFGGFGAGVGMVKAILDFRAERKNKIQLEVLD